MDWLYLSGMLIIWSGNIFQIRRMIKTHSTKSLSMWWLYAIGASFLLRMPRALSSDYWVWSTSYVISLVIVGSLIGIATYYGKKYKRK